MPTYSQMLKDAQARRIELRKEMDGLDRVIASLEALGGKRGSGRPPGPSKNAATRAKRGSWKPGSPGRPPNWYVEQQKAKAAAAGKSKPVKKKAAKRKNKATPKQLAALKKARAARTAKKQASK